MLVLAEELLALAFRRYRLRRAVGCVVSSQAATAGQLKRTYLPIRKCGTGSRQRRRVLLVIHPRETFKRTASSVGVSKSFG
jgi:hypothetical protein